MGWHNLLSMDDIAQLQESFDAAPAYTGDNLAHQLDDDQRVKIAQRVVDDYQADDDARKEWLANQAEWHELYHQTDRPTGDVQTWQSSESMPILTEGCNQFRARGYKALFPSRDFIAARPANESDPAAQEAARRVAGYYNYELNYGMRYYKRDKNNMLLAVAIAGSDFTKAYWDGRRGRKVVERVRAEDLVVPYGIGPRSLEDLPRKTHVIPMSLNEAKRLHLSGDFLQPLAADDYTSSQNELESVKGEIDGIADSNTAEKGYGIVLEQHRTLDIGEHPDGLELPYIVSVCKQSGKLLSIKRRWKQDINGNPIGDYEPIEFFTHYEFMPNPDGFYGLGLGHIAGNLNRAINSMIREILDASRLANEGNMSGFMSERVAVAGKEVAMKIGRFLKIPRVENLSNEIYQMKFPGPNAAHVQMMQMLEGIARRLISSSDIATGDVGKVMQPMTIMTLLDSALQMPTAVMENIAASFEDELAKLYALDQANITQRIAVNIGKEGFSVGPDDFANDLKIVPIIDPRSFTRQQRVAKAQESYNFIASNPVLSQDPNVLMEASRRVLSALEVEDIEALMPKAPEPEYFRDQRKENMFLMMPPEGRPLFDVAPDDDHTAHIAEIDLLLAQVDESARPDVMPQEIDEAIAKAIDSMSSAYKQRVVADLMTHRQKHIAYLYGQRTGVLPDARGRGIGAMGGPSSNPMVPGGDGAANSFSGAATLPAGQGGFLEGEAGGAGLDALIGIGQGLTGLGQTDYGRSLNNGGV